MILKNSSRWLLTLFAALVLFAALAAFKFFQIQAAIAFGKSFPEASASVHAVKVVASSITRYATTIAEVVAPESIQLRNELEGRIALVNVRSGTRVKKGATLLQLDVSEESARLKAAQARVELAELELQRVKKLYQQKTVSEDQLDKARANYDIALADTQALQAIIDKKTLRAPFDAIVGLHNWEVGEFLQANTFIATLVGINDYTWIDFNLPLQQAALKLNSKVKVMLSEHFSEQQNESRQAVVIARDAAASSTSRNLRFRARLEGQPLPLPNAVVKVAVPTGQSTLITIPAIAVLEDDMGTYVYVLTADASGKGYRAQRRAVTVSEQTETYASIIAGLQEGDLVASDGAFKLHTNILTFVVANDENGGQDSAKGVAAPSASTPSASANSQPER